MHGMVLLQLLSTQWRAMGCCLGGITFTACGRIFLFTSIAEPALFARTVFPRVIPLLSCGRCHSAGGVVMSWVTFCVQCTIEGWLFLLSSILRVWSILFLFLFVFSFSLSFLLSRCASDFYRFLFILLVFLLMCLFFAIFLFNPVFLLTRHTGRTFMISHDFLHLHFTYASIIFLLVAPYLRGNVM